MDSSSGNSHDGCHVLVIPPDEEILTVRCRLRYPLESDMRHVWTATRTPGFNDGLTWDPPSNISELYEPLKRSWDSWAEGSAYSWSVESRESGDFLGRIAIRREAHHGIWSIGFWIHPTEQGNGYASEVSKAIIEFGFARLKADVITAAHATWNHASGTVLRRVGMIQVRTNPRGFRKKGRWVEELEYELRAD